MGRTGTDNYGPAPMSLPLVEPLLPWALIVVVYAQGDVLSSPVIWSRYATEAECSRHTSLPLLNRRRGSLLTVCRHIDESLDPDENH